MKGPFGSTRDEPAGEKTAPATAGHAERASAWRAPPGRAGADEALPVILPDIQIQSTHFAPGGGRGPLASPPCPARRARKVPLTRTNARVLSDGKKRTKARKSHKPIRMNS